MVLAAFIGLFIKHEIHTLASEHVPVDVKRYLAKQSISVLRKISDCDNVMKRPLEMTLNHIFI